MKNLATISSAAALAMLVAANTMLVAPARAQGAADGDVPLTVET